MENTFFIMNITSEIDDNVKNTFKNILGVFGTILTTSIYIPQIYRSYKKKIVEISWIMLGLELFSDIVWILYYYLNEIYFPILTGSCIFSFASTLSFMKIYYNKKSYLENP